MQNWLKDRSSRGRQEKVGGVGQEKTNLFESESSALISSKRSYISQGQLMSNKELYKVLRSQLNVK